MLHSGRPKAHGDDHSSFHCLFRRIELCKLRVYSLLLHSELVLAATSCSKTTRKLGFEPKAINIGLIFQLELWMTSNQ